MTSYSLATMFAIAYHRGMKKLKPEAQTVTTQEATADVTLNSPRRPIRYADTRVGRNQLVRWIDPETGETRVAKFKRCPYHRLPRQQVKQ